MKKVQGRIWILAATVALATAMGCNKEPDYTPITTKTPLAITVSVAQEPQPQAAASKAALRDEAFAVGEKLGLYVVAWRKPGLAGVLEPTGNYADNAEVTYLADGSKWSFATSVFYPTVMVDLYGYAPYNADFKPTATPDAYKFTVKADQSTKINDNDLLTALNSEVTTSTTALAMTFYHRLSRVEVKFKLPASFKGKEIKDVVSVKLKHVRPTAVVDLITPYDYTVDGATSIGAGYPKPAVVDGTSVPVDIIPNVVQPSAAGSNDLIDDNKNYFIYEALVPPQSIAANTGFVEIVVGYTDGSTETFYYTTPTPVSPPAPLTFVAAKSTVIKVNFQADHTILLGTVGIAKWEPITDEEGEMVEHEVFNQFTLTLPAASATQVAFVTLTTKAGTADAKEYQLPATHAINTTKITCAFDGTQDSPEFYTFDITKIEWFGADKVLLDKKEFGNTPVSLTASGPIAITL